MATQIDYLSIPKQETIKGYMYATLTTNQTTNVSVGDHAKFQLVREKRGSSITLDTTTPYTSTSGVASLGRFTLQGGKSYRINTTISASFSTNAVFRLRWTDVTTATRILLSNNCFITSFYAFSILTFPSYCIDALITTTSNRLIELTIDTISAGTITDLRYAAITNVGVDDFTGVVAIIKEI